MLKLPSSTTYHARAAENQLHPVKVQPYLQPFLPEVSLHSQAELKNEVHAMHKRKTSANSSR